MEQSQLTALMSALQTAGYDFHTDESSETHQIILNSVNEAIIVDNQVDLNRLYFVFMGVAC